MSTLSYTYNLTANTPARAAEVMQNFNDAKTVINGNIGPTNVDLTAAYPWTGIHTWEMQEAKVSGMTHGYFMPIEFMQPGLFNIGFAQGADSSQLKITSFSGADLNSTTNPGFVKIRSSTAGTSRTFRVTSNVTIDLTGAHWGLDTKGNTTGSILRVYAIDDNGTLRWGVGYQGGFEYIRNTQDDTTATNINLPEEILTDTAVGTDNSPMNDVGYVLAGFTDATNEWAIASYFPSRSADGIWQPWTTTHSGFTGTIPTYGVLQWTQYGKTVHLKSAPTANGTSNATTFSMTAPLKARVADVAGNFVGSIDNNVAQTTPGSVETTASSATLTLNKAHTAASGWTNVNGKAAYFGFLYEAYQP